MAEKAAIIGNFAECMSERLPAIRSLINQSVLAMDRSLGGTGNLKSIEKVRDAYHELARDFEKISEFAPKSLTSQFLERVGITAYSAYTCKAFTSEGKLAELTLEESDQKKIAFLSAKRLKLEATKMIEFVNQDYDLLQNDRDKVLGVLSRIVSNSSIVADFEQSLKLKAKQ